MDVNDSYPENIVTNRSKHCSCWNGLSRPGHRRHLQRGSAVILISCRKNISAILFLQIIACLGAKVVSSQNTNVVEVLEGSPVSLPCRINDSSLITREGSIVTWSNRDRHNVLQKQALESSIQGTWSDKGTITPDGSLKIFSTLVEDSGMYTCTLNGLGSRVESASVQLSVSVGKPTIRGDSSLMFRRGKTFMLSCYGIFPLQWKIPPNAYRRATITSLLEPPGNYTSLEYGVWKEVSNMTVASAEYQDFGEYKCFHQHGLQHGEDTANTAATSVFVYIRSRDHGKILPVEANTIKVIANFPFIIPCKAFPNYVPILRPTQKFYKNLSERRERRSYLDGKTSENDSVEEVVRYDPRVGFLVPMYQHWFGDAVRCEITISDNKTEMLKFSLDVIVKPHLNESDKLVLRESRVLSLSCTGKLPIIWFFPESDLLKVPSITSRTEILPSGEYLYYSTLRINIADYTDTGEYSCAYGQLQSLSLLDMKSSTYVFVKSSDSNKQFLPQDEDTINISNNMPFIIPCRSTNPDATVTLKVYYNLAQTVVTNFTNFWHEDYDPKRGFLMTPNPDENKSFAAITLHAICEIGMMSHQNFYLYPGSGIAPHLTTNSTTVIQMQSVELKCEIDIPLHLLLDPENRPHFYWEFTGQKRDASKCCPLEEDNGDTSSIRYYSVLKIPSITADGPEKSNHYTCNVHNKIFKYNVTITLHVLDHGYVNLSSPVKLTDGVGLFTIKQRSDRHCFEAVLDSFPAASYEWIKDEVVLQEGETDLVFLEDEDGQVYHLQLCLPSVAPRFEGLFELRAYNEYDQDSVAFNLTVLVPPTVSISVEPPGMRASMTSSTELYQFQNDYTLICTVSGNPIPNLLWKFSLCSDSSEQDSCQLRGRTGFQTLQKNSYSWLYGLDRRSDGNYMVDINADKSGIFKCEAEGTDYFPIAVEQSVRFAVTSIDHGIDLSASSSEVYGRKTDDSIAVYEGSTLTITCLASAYAFKTVTFMKRSFNNETLEDISLKDYEKSTRGNVYKFELVIRNITKKNSKVYVCQALESNEDAEPVYREMAVEVQEVVRPSIIEPSGALTLDIKTEGLELNCTAVGDPLPFIFWQQDDERVTDSTFEIINRTTSLSVLRKTRRYFQFRKADSSIFECIARSGSTAAVVRTVSVEFVSSPTVSTTKNEIYIKSGDNVTMSCDADGKPTPKISWKKPTSNNFTLGRFSVINGSLIIYEVEESMSGKYLCIARNAYGSQYQEITLDVAPVEIERKDDYTVLIIICATLLGAVLIICAFVFISLVKEKKSAEQENPRSPGPLPLAGHFQTLFDMGIIMHPEEMYERLPYDPQWEFTRERLHLGPVIGQGAYGMVLKAKAVGIGGTDHSSIVAIKTLKRGAAELEKKALWAELKLLAHVGRHLNVVNFLGACTTESPLLLIVEFCTYGNLSEYLRKKRKLFYGSRENTGSDSSQSQPSTSASLPEFSNESKLGTIPESDMEKKANSAGSSNPESGQRSHDSAVGISDTGSITLSYTKNKTSDTPPPRLKSRSNIDLTDGSVSPLVRKKITSEIQNSVGSNTLSLGAISSNVIGRRSPDPELAQFLEDWSGSPAELPIREEDLICYAFQVARGMEFLSSKQIIHRDLAARNVLLTDDNVVKICDFGLARHLYHNPDYVASGKGRFPIKWMALESIFDKIYTTYSDIWSFGVLLWEMFSLGGSPYPGLQIDETFYQKLKEGYRMESPEYAPPAIYDMMLECWAHEATDRPSSFQVLENTLGDLLQASTRQEYIELNEPYENLNAELEAQQVEHLLETTPLVSKPSVRSMDHRTSILSIFSSDRSDGHHLPQGDPSANKKRRTSVRSIFSSDRSDGHKLPQKEAQTRV